MRAQISLTNLDAILQRIRKPNSDRSWDVIRPKLVKSAAAVYQKGCDG